MALQSLLSSFVGVSRIRCLGPQDVVQNAETQLRNSGYLELRRLQCSFHDGVLTLNGHVSSYYLRQIAQSSVQGLQGVVAINNQLLVLPRRLGYCSSVSG
jgi:hypothetical protein